MDRVYSNVPEEEITAGKYQVYQKILREKKGYTYVGIKSNHFYSFNVSLEIFSSSEHKHNI